MRDYLLVYLNGEPLRIRGERALRVLSSFLRNERRATGTKIVCEEGDCGACTVLIGRADEGRIIYRPVNSCILQLHQLDCAHIVTVEGLRENGGLHEVQQQMMVNHGAQCGFCTPGFITAMAAMFEDRDRLAEEEVRRGLTGNLCRCTGYEPIIKAALAVDPGRLRRINDLYPPDEMLAAFEQYGAEPVRIDAGNRHFLAAADLEGAAAFKSEHPESVMIHGATDVGVWVNKRAFVPEAVLNITKIPEMNEIGVSDGVLEVGGTVSLWTLQQFVRDLVPQLYDILEIFGSPQIRHAGTLAGNIANGSPIADTVPFLFVMDAELELFGTSGARSVNILNFYKGYKTFDMAPDELISRIRIPLPDSDEIVRLYKVSKRRDLDISSFTAAFRMRREDDRIREIRIAYGGVGPVVLRLPETEAFLTGRTVSEETFAGAGPVARAEITPISDVRGSADFRYALAERILLKFYYECAGEEVYA